MLKSRIFALFIALTCVVIVQAQMPSPQQFLGYQLGDHFTPHLKIVNYFNALAQANPATMKLQRYGTTYEGRDLLLAYISTPDNLAKLDAIRQNNLALAGMGNTSANSNGAPAIVWLSYNVHGNEASSSEAAMLTAYTLLDPQNSQAKEWLKNTIVIIDPCINPDGRDRYVNWYNSVSGVQPNPDPQAREHNEPWPGGRSNHYNFDLNRDWAWQTQQETQLRMKQYNSWLPQIHVDFHEQGYNNPYYFAPAAEPYHQVITPWQRSFQNTIGRNNAKYFDQNGWLFFTKESFDLFYPSYGDTYPLYNGAIGMTYEQGGGPRGGLAVKTSAGDTLTLLDRLTHHFTTGMATIEEASKNAPQLIAEFKKFFDDSKTGNASSTKTYVLSSNTKATINSIATLLDANGITYGSLQNRSFTGTNYITGKSEKPALKQYNIAISAAQPKSTLARVLLEPTSVLADSVTYDITAWSLPYVYNVDAYTSNQSLPLQPLQTADVQQNITASPYGYLIKYNSVNSVKLLGQLLQKGIKVRYSLKPFTYNNQEFDRGTLIVLQKGNSPGLLQLINQFNKEDPAEVIPVSTGFMDKGPDFGSPDIRLIKMPKVAMLTGEQVSSLSAGEVWHFFEQQIKYPVTLINAGDLGRTNLNQYNVLIMPDGYYQNISDKNITDKLKEFVRDGGNLVALENAVKQLSAGEWNLKSKEEKEDTEAADKVDYTLLKRYENRERDDLQSAIPGAIYKVDLDNSHPLAFGYGNSYFTLKQQADVYSYLREGWNVGYLKKDNYITGFAGNKVRQQINDGVVFGVINIGNGTLTFLADDPLFREFWQGGKLLFSNAVFLVGQ